MRVIAGEFRSRRLKNTSDELRMQDEKLRRILIDSCRRLGLIVVGYSGRLGAIGTDVTLATLTVTQMAARVTFTPPSPLANKDTGNWFAKVTIPVIIKERSLG